MVAVPALYRTTIGKKALMAITGFIGYGFVIIHMIGNFKVLEGSTGFNAYAEFLRTVGEPFLPHTVLLWIARTVLLTALIIHVWMAISLTRQDRAARPVDYANKRRVQATFASLTLRWGGVALFFFIIYHLLHFTIGWAHPNFVPGDAYGNVVIGFQNPIVVLIYLLAMVALAMHLYHGVWSMFQSLGLNNGRTNSIWRGLAVLSGVLLFLGFSFVPIAVVTGLVR